jgi:hypothetical protein
VTQNSIKQAHRAAAPAGSSRVKHLHPKIFPLVSIYHKRLAHLSPADRTLAEGLRSCKPFEIPTLSAQQLVPARHNANPLTLLKAQTTLVCKLVCVPSSRLPFSRLLLLLLLLIFEVIEQLRLLEHQLLVLLLLLLLLLLLVLLLPLIQPLSLLMQLLLVRMF